MSFAAINVIFVVAITELTTWKLSYFCEIRVCFCTGHLNLGTSISDSLHLINSFAQRDFAGFLTFVLPDTCNDLAESFGMYSMQTLTLESHGVERVARLSLYDITFLNLCPFE